MRTQEWNLRINHILKKLIRFFIRQKIKYHTSSNTASAIVVKIVY